MQTFVTCRSNRTTESLTAQTDIGPLPEYQRIISDQEPPQVVLDAMREAAQFHLGPYPCFTENQLYPLPDGLPWSARGVQLAAGEEWRSEAFYSAKAWLLRRPGARYQLRLSTLDAGFDIEWTFELLDGDTAVFTAESTPGVGIEIFETERIDQPIAFSPPPPHIDTDDGCLEYLGFRRIGEWTSADTGESTALVIEVQR